MKYESEDLERTNLESRNALLQAEIKLLQAEIERLKLENARLLSLVEAPLRLPKSAATSSLSLITQKDPVSQILSISPVKGGNLRRTASFTEASKVVPKESIISGEIVYKSSIDGSVRRTSGLNDSSKDTSIKLATIKRTSPGLLIEDTPPKKGLIKMLVQHDEKEQLEVLINNILKELWLDAQDSNCLYAVLKGIMIVIPDIMTKYITIKPTSCIIESHVKNFWSFTEEEMLQILDTVKLALIKQFQSKALKDITYQLFKNEKLFLLEKTLHRLFADNLSKSFNQHIANHNKDIDRHKYSNKHDFINNYLYNSIEFKANLKSLCYAILAPSPKLLHLSTILKAKDFSPIFQSSDFVHDSIILMWNEIQKIIFIPQQHKMPLAATLFEKHKYIFCYGELEKESFLHALESLSWVFKYAKLSETTIKKAVNIFGEKFTNFEIYALKAHLEKLQQGLVKWHKADDLSDNMDLLNQLQSELECKEGRLRFLQIGTNTSNYDKGRILQSIKSSSSKLEIIEPRNNTFVIEPVTELPKIVITSDLTDTKKSHASGIVREDLEKK